MLIKTHLAIAICMILLFVPYVNDKVVFVIALLIAAGIPDIDMSSSTMGQKKIFRPLQFFVKHRGMIHSFTLGVLLSVLIAVFFPIAALGFFIGYSVHIFADSFTRDGVTPFWPYQGKSKGPVPTGGRIETTVFLVFVIIDIGLIVIAFI